MKILQIIINFISEVTTYVVAFMLSLSATVGSWDDIGVRASLFAAGFSIFLTAYRLEKYKSGKA